MKLVPPIAVTDAILTASSVAENEYLAWSNGTTYAAGQRSVRSHRVYESLVAGNLNHDPLGAAGYWLDIGPTNRWAMFDKATGPRTTATGTITLTLAPAAATVSTVALLDIYAATARLVVRNGASVLYDQTRSVATASLIIFADLPAGTAIDVTVAPRDGQAAVGKLIIGKPIELGATEADPTVGITDYSRRETDQFGITTVVERNWAKRVSLQVKIDNDRIEAVRAAIVAARATPMLWVGEDGYESLTAYGIYKDFSAVLRLETFSYCSLTIEALSAADKSGIVAGDPAAGTTSDMLVVRPVQVTVSNLVSSNVPETDYVPWADGDSYATGARVRSSITHRVYESLIDNNTGNDPTAAGASKWIDAGPTIRWAMFDEAIGSDTTGTGGIVVVLQPGVPLNAVAVLDTNAVSVRVQAPGYDKTRQATVGGVTASTLTFLDLATGPSDSITITMAAANANAPVSVGTLIIGQISLLGRTADEPQFGINDFSRKETDDFGATDVVERAWAKKMSAQAMIRSDAAEGVLRNIATVRARPSLWIAQDGVEALTIYGFFKEASVSLGENVSTLSLSIEGLSTATTFLPAAPVNVSWPDIADPTGTKPANNATNTRDPSTPLGSGGKTIATILQDIDDLASGVGVDNTPPGIPTGLITDGGQLVGAGVDIEFGWNANSDTDLAYYVLAVALGGGDFIQFIAPTNRFKFFQLAPNLPYQAKVRAVDRVGNSSLFSPVKSGNTIKDSVAPGPPTGFAALAGIGAVVLRWVAPTAPDVATIRIYEGSTDQFADAVLVATLNAEPGQPGGTIRSFPPGDERTYWATAVDTSDNESVKAGPVEVTAAKVTHEDIAVDTALANLIIANTAVVTQDFVAKVIAGTDSLPGRLTIGNTGFKLETIQPGMAAIAGSNRIKYSDFEAGVGGWQVYTPTGIAGIDPGVSSGMRYLNIACNFFNAPNAVVIDSQPFDVTPNERLSFQAVLGGGGVNGFQRLGIVWLRPDGSYIDEYTNQYEYGDLAFPSIRGNFCVAHPQARRGVLRLVLDATGPGSPLLTIAHPMVASATAASTILPMYEPSGNIPDPAAVVNRNTTLIEPGRIRVGGGNTLSSLMNGPDSTEINGGKIAANSIRLNSAVIGMRGINTVGITFDHNRNDVVTWSNGYVDWVDGNGNRQVTYIQGGAASRFSGGGAVSGIAYVWFDAAASPQSQNLYGGEQTPANILANPNNVILATYWGGTYLNANYARTVIDRDTIKTGAVSADKMDVFSLDAITARIGLLRTATSGERMELSNGRLEVFDANNVLRVRIGVGI